MPELETCPACDGEGSLMFQWAKEHMIRTNGRRVFMDKDHRDWYYVTGEGQEIPFKTIGGPCHMCWGKKVVSKK